MKNIFKEEKFEELFKDMVYKKNNGLPYVSPEFNGSVKINFLWALYCVIKEKPLLFYGFLASVIIFTGLNLM